MTKRNPLQKPLWMLSLVIALLSLLPLLAVLQYRWLGQVSEGERERMRNNLNASARQFCQDFDSELMAICMSFQPTYNPFGSQVGQGPDDFATRYRQWRETSAHPKVIKEIYQTQTGEDDGRLARFNVETGAFELCEWPVNLTKVRKTLEENRARHESLRVMMRETFERKVNIGDSGVKKMVIQFGLGSVDGDLPGLIIPISA